MKSCKLVWCNRPTRSDQLDIAQMSLTDCLIRFSHLVFVLIFSLSLQLLCLLLWTGSVGGDFRVYIMLRPVSTCLWEVVLPPLCIRSCIMVTVWGSFGWLLACFDLFCSLISCFLWVCMLLSLVVMFGSTFGAFIWISCPHFLCFVCLTFCRFHTGHLLLSHLLLVPLILLFLSLLCLGSGSSCGLGFKDHIVGLGHRCGARLDGLWTRDWASFWWPYTDELGKTWRGVEPLDVFGCSGGVLPTVYYI